MAHTIKTILFVLVAVVSAAGAMASHYWTRPQPVSGFEKVGQAFFPDFQDPKQAMSLEVSAIDQTTHQFRQFKVEQVDGTWCIPSHHNYPAEAADRLAQTATSLMGLARQAMAGRREIQHAQYGVVTPVANGEEDPEQMGRRITLRDAQGEILADYVVGKPVRDEKDATLLFGSKELPVPYYYVRVPGEKETYQTELQVELSTRFADWIHPDLLKITPDDLRFIRFDNYRLEKRATVNQAGQMTQQVVKIKRDAPQLRRGTEPDSWRLTDLDEAKEVMETSALQEFIEYLDTLAIADVQPLLRYQDHPMLTADFQLASIPELKNNPRLFDQIGAQLEAQLDSMGFQVAVVDSKTKQRGLVASNGAIEFTTFEGVHYVLYLGNAFVDENTDIELMADAPATEPSEEEAAPADNDSESTTSDDDSANELQKNRYVAIRVSFDEAALRTSLGPAPLEPSSPERPEKPEGYDEWKKEQDEKANAEDDDEGQEADNQDAPELPEDLESESESATDLETDTDEAYQAYQTAKQVYDAAKEQYELDRMAFERDAEQFKIQKQQGQEKAQALNERFRTWFYVVSAESLANLSLTRTDFYKAKESPSPDETVPAGSPLTPLTDPPSSESNDADSSSEPDVEPESEED